MIKVLLTLLVTGFLGLVFSLPVSAQESGPLPGDTPTIQQMRLQVFPEYDDPRVLVIAQGRLAAPDGTFNGPVTFRLPAGAQINQMAVLDLTLGSPQFQPFETRPDPTDPAWMLVTYTLTNPHFFYEYYYNSLAGGSQKQFTFAFKSVSDIEILTLEIQQPLKAEAFILEPPALNSRNDPSGFTYWQYEERPVAAGEEVSFVTRYTKTDPSPSVANPSVANPSVGTAGQEAAPETAGSDTLSDSSWVGLTIIGIVVVIAFGFARHRWQPARPGRTAGAGVPTPGPASNPALSPGTISSDWAGERPEERPEVRREARFCTGCGQDLPSHAGFCPYCGKEVRK
jgi:hypothetical protein